MSNLAVVERLEHLIKDQPQNPLRPTQAEAYREELDRCESILSAPRFVQADRNNAAIRALQLRKMLADQSARPIESEYVKAEVNRLTSEVMEKIIQPSMLPRSVMRRNPQGAVSTYMRRESSPLVKRAILTWKRARFALDPNTDNMDHANIELYRPEGGGNDGAATFMADAQLPGNFAMSPLAKENWPLGDPTAKTATSHMNMGDSGKKGMMKEAPEVLCECGCGRKFKPRAINQKFFSASCRNRFAKRNIMAGQNIPRPEGLGSDISDTGSTKEG